MSKKKSLVEKHNPVKDRTMTETKFVWIQIEPFSKKVFKSISIKTGVAVKLFQEKFKESFNVEHYRGKSEDEFAEIIYNKVIKAVLEEQGFKMTNYQL